MDGTLKFLFIDNHPPLIKPKLRKHSMAYSEQVGKNLQFFPIIGESK